MNWKRHYLNSALLFLEAAYEIETNTGNIMDIYCMIKDIKTILEEEANNDNQNESN